jgi:hypothetical protein
MPALSITRTASGLMVNAFGFDSDDNVIYRIKNNEFEHLEIRPTYYQIELNPRTITDPEV